MRAWLDRFTYTSTALHHVGDFVLNLLIATGGTSLVILGLFLFT